MPFEELPPKSVIPPSTPEEGLVRPAPAPLEQSEGGHLTHEQIFQYLEKRFELPEESPLRRTVIDHIADCSRCRAKFILAHQTIVDFETGNLPEPSPESIQRAVSLIMGHREAEADTSHPSASLSAQETIQEEEIWALAAQGQGKPGWKQKMAFPLSSPDALIFLVFELQDLWAYASLHSDSALERVRINSNSSETVELQRAGPRKLIGDLEEMHLTEASTESQIRSALKNMLITAAD